MVKFTELLLKIAGFVKDPVGKVHWLIQGIWDSHLDILKVTNEVNTGENARFETDEPIRIWTINSPVYVASRLSIFNFIVSKWNCFQSMHCKVQKVIILTIK